MKTKTIEMPYVSELLEIDTNLNDLEKELDTLLAAKEKQEQSTGKFSLDSFKAVKGIKQDIEDLEKVIADAYKVRAQIVSEVKHQYIKQIESECRALDNELLQEAYSLFEGKDFKQVTTNLYKLSELLESQRVMYKSNDAALNQLVKVFGIEVSQHDLPTRVNSFNSPQGVRAYAIKIRKSLDEWLKAEIFSGIHSKPFEIET